MIYQQLQKTSPLSYVRVLTWIEAWCAWEGANPEESRKRHWRVIRVIQVILVILWPHCILIAPQVRQFSHTENIHLLHKNRISYWVLTFNLLVLNNQCTLKWLMDWEISITVILFKRLGFSFGVDSSPAQLKRVQFQLRSHQQEVEEGLGGDRKHWTPPIIAFSALTTKSQTKVMEDLIIQSKRLRFQFGGGRGDIVGNPAVMNSFGILSWD